MRSDHYDFYEKNSSRLGRIASFAGIAFLATISASYIFSVALTSNSSEIIQLVEDDAGQGEFDNAALETP